MKTLTKKHFSDTNQSVDEWVNTIETKFSSEFKFQTRVKELSEALFIEKPNELAKLEKANLIVFGKSLGVLSFEDACKKLGVSTKLPDVSTFPSKHRKHYIAEHKIITIIEALNEGWTPNWNDSNEYKWVPIFNIPGTFSFSAAYYNWLFTHNNGGSCLCFKNKDLAEFMGRYFIELYKDYLK